MANNYKKRFHNIITHVSTRKKGVSGMMRVRNDSEFIEACIESCIDALDELIIVYNDCSDSSPMIIQKMVNKYPEKIRAYEYLPEIFAWNLDEKQVHDILSGEINEANTLSGYYNFALQKTSYEFVMKIDADQIYFTQKLKLITDAYRCKRIWYKPPITAYYYLIKFVVYFFAAKHFKHIRFKINRSFCCNYVNNMLKLIKYSKNNSSLSGYNVYNKNGNLYHSLGKNTKDGYPNILVPFNGEGDHPIFKVKSSTYFVPSHDSKYENLLKSGKCVIEKLINIGTIGKGSLLPLGVCWLHLNANRKANYIAQAKVFELYREFFITTKYFAELDIKTIVNNQSSIANWILFDFIHKIDNDNFIEEKTMKYLNTIL